MRTAVNQAASRAQSELVALLGFGCADDDIFSDQAAQSDDVAAAASELTG